MSLRGDLLDKLELQTGNQTLNPLLPRLPTDDVLEACEQITKEQYPTLLTLPKTQWPPAQAISLVAGSTQGLLYTATGGSGHASFVTGFSRGAAVNGLLVVPKQLMQLDTIVRKTVEPISIGDAEIPDVAPWLVRPLIESAKNILDKTDPINLRDVLAFNYGLFWAAAAIVPPAHRGRQTSALKWLQEVAEYYGGLGLVPA